MNSSISLVNPPQMVPDMPLCAFPILKAALNDHGIQSKIIDSNIKYYHTLLSEENLRNHGQVPQEYKTLDDFIVTVQEAKRDVRRILPFNELGKYPVARRVLDNTLDFLVKKYEVKVWLQSYM